LLERARGISRPPLLRSSVAMRNVKRIAPLPTLSADICEVCLSVSSGICFISGIDFRYKLPQVSTVKISACAATPGSILCVCLFYGALPPTKHVNKIRIPAPDSFNLAGSLNIDRGEGEAAKNCADRSKRCLDFNK